LKPSKLIYAIQLTAILAFIGFTQTSLFVCDTSAEEIISVSTLEYYPWTGKDLKNNGFVNHVITEAFKRKGYTVRYKYLPWKRAVLETKNGKFAALSYVYFSKDREKEFYLSDPISEEKIVIFHLKSNQIKAWKHLERSISQPQEKRS
jgi:polar amino acid transport system substrate-binding protein